MVGRHPLFIVHERLDHEETRPDSNEEKMAALKGFKITLCGDYGTVNVHWKQGSMLGIGGDKSQTYYKCRYKLDSGAEIPVFIQCGWEKPKSTTIDGRFQFGQTNGMIFFVLHDKSQTPYQKRFVENENWVAKIGESALGLLKTIKGFDLSWIAGDYLHNI